VKRCFALRKVEVFGLDKRTPAPLVQSVDRALVLLDFLADGTPSWGISELSRTTKLSKAAVYRLLRTLERHGYAAKADDHRYALGTKPIELAGVVLNSFESRQVARSTMVALAKRTGESVVLTAPSRNGVICLDTVEGPHPLRASFQVGRVTPWHAGAAGKLHLAFMPDDRVRKIVARKLPRFTERTITDKVTLIRDLTRIRIQGYAVTAGELHPGVAAVSAPIVDSQKEVIAGISIAGPDFRFSDDRLAHLIEEVRWAAAEVSKRLLGNVARTVAQPGSKQQSLKREVRLSSVD
jgi:DNA-binding IclR family transcriptional regulator